MDAKSLGKILTNFRKEEGISTESKLGELLYETQQSINKKIQGLVPWKLSTMIELTKILNFKMILENGDVSIMKNNKVVNEILSEEIKEVKKFGRYSIIEIYSNSENGIYGNIYTSMDETLSNRGDALSRDNNSKVLIGYCLYDTKLGYTPDDAKDWHDTIDSAEWEYNNFYEVIKELDFENVREEVIEFWEKNVEDSALSHISAYKDRYYGKSLSQIEFDLDVNHDMSLEYEYVEEELNIELTSNELKYIAASFNKAVLDMFKNGCSHLLNL